MIWHRIDHDKKSKFMQLTSMWLEQGFDDGSGGGKCISAIIK